MRDFKKRRYLFAFVITAAIFSLGFFFGFVMDIQRIDYFTSLNEKQKLDLQSLQMQYNLIEDISVEDQCSVLRFIFDKAVNELEQNRGRLEMYSEQSKLKKEDFDTLRREYTLSQINFWQISRRLKDTCPDNSDFVTIIYFFSDSDTCPSCDKQAIVLDYYKEVFKENLLIFAMDEKFSETEPLITVLKQAYNITKYPTLIIDSTKYSGYVKKDYMDKILCGLYKNPSPELCPVEV
jgi:thiol-disulfide isomerase/thioredoxin